MIRQLSVSQVEKFDHKQEGGCQRRWWFENVKGLYPDQHKAQHEGEAGHALLAHYLATGEHPRGRPLMGKAVTGAIVKGDLPTPGDDLVIEQRFDGQPKLDAEGKWVPLDVANTFHLGGLPWDGFIDLTFRRGDVPEVWDHKFSSDVDLYAKKNSDLIKTVQMPIYVLSQVPYWPDAKRWKIAHHYVSKKGVHSFIRSAVVDIADALARGEDITSQVSQMRVVETATDQADVPANTRSCESWRGCPMQSVCSAFKSRSTTGGRTPMALTEDEQRIFDGIPDDTAPAPDSAGEMIAPPEPEDDGEAALKAQLEAAQKALAEKQAKKAPRRALIHDTAESKAQNTAVPPLPSSAAANAAPPACVKCGEQLSAENGSKLQSGEWKHVGCPKDAPPPPPPRERATTKKPAAAPPIPGAESKPETEAPKPATPPASPPAFAGERQSDRDARAAMEAARAAKSPKAEPTVTTTAAAPLADLREVVRGMQSREALANVFQSIADLIRVS